MAYYRPLGFQELWGSHISTQSAHGGRKVVSPTHRPPLTPGNIYGTNFYYRLNTAQDHSADGRFMSKKYTNCTIGNRTCDLPSASTNCTTAWLLLVNIALIINCIYKEHRTYIPLGT
jgi:hypothetical protein